MNHPQLWICERGCKIIALNVKDHHNKKKGTVTFTCLYCDGRVVYHDRTVNGPTLAKRFGKGLTS